jgi:hypothetical protein
MISFEIKLNEILRKELTYSYNPEPFSLFISERAKVDCIFLLKKIISSSFTPKTLQAINLNLETFTDCKTLMLWLESHFNRITQDETTSIIGTIINKIAKIFVLASFLLIPNGIQVILFMVFNLNLNSELNLIFKPLSSNEDKSKRFKLWNQISESLLLRTSSHVYHIFYGSIRLNTKTPIYETMDCFLNQIRFELTGDSDCNRTKFSINTGWSIRSDKKNNLSSFLEIDIFDKTYNYRLFFMKDFHNYQYTDLNRNFNGLVASFIFLPFLFSPFSPIQVELDTNPFIVIHAEDIEHITKIKKQMNRDARLQKLSNFGEKVFSQIIEKSTSKTSDFFVDKGPNLFKNLLKRIASFRPFRQRRIENNNTLQPAESLQPNQTQLTSTINTINTSSRPRPPIAAMSFRMSRSGITYVNQKNKVASIRRALNTSNISGIKQHKTGRFSQQLAIPGQDLIVGPPGSLSNCLRIIIPFATNEPLQDTQGIDVKLDNEEKSQIVLLCPSPSLQSTRSKLFTVSASEFFNKIEPMYIM